VWAEQVGSNGGRVFYVMSASDMATYVTPAGQPQPRCVYEVVYEGYSIRPYYDLEYLRDCNADRAAEADQALIDSLIAGTDAVLQGVGHRIDHSKVVVLDSSSAAKFSVHIILPMQNGAALCGVPDARVVAARVLQSLTAEQAMARTADGGMRAIVDLDVYHKNQQMRIMHCTKMGDPRVLRPHICMQGRLPAFEDTLICVQRPHQSLCATFAAQVLQQMPSIAAEEGTVRGASGPTTGQQCTETALHSAMPALATHLQQHLHVVLYRVQQHATRPDLPSLFVHTASTTCASRTHNSNTVVVEIRCDKNEWRLLCRDPTCRPGDWQLLPLRCLAPGNAAPAWLVQHLKKHCYLV